MTLSFIPALCFLGLFLGACKNPSTGAKDASALDTVAAGSGYTACQPSQMEPRASTATTVAAMLQPRANPGEKVPSQAFNAKKFVRPVKAVFPMGHKFYSGDSPVTGYPHEGFDYSGTDELVSQGIVMDGEPILAITGGRVAFVMDICKTGDRMCGDGWGNHVVIDHGGSVFSRYAHMQRTRAKVNQVVTPGTVIGETGMTGWTAGVHLHIEIGTMSAGLAIEQCKPTFFSRVWDPASYLSDAGY